MGKEEHSTKRVRLVTAASKDLLHQTIGHCPWPVGSWVQEVSSSNCLYSLVVQESGDSPRKVWEVNETQELEGRGVWKVEWHIMSKGSETGLRRPRNFLAELLPLSLLPRSLRTSPDALLTSRASLLQGPPGQPGASRAAQDMLFLAPAATSGCQTLNQSITIPCGQPVVPNLREGLAPTPTGPGGSLKTAPTVLCDHLISRLHRGQGLPFFFHQQESE